MGVEGGVGMRDGLVGFIGGLGFAIGLCWGWAAEVGIMV